MRHRGAWIAGAAVFVTVLAVGVWGIVRAQEFQSAAQAGKDAVAAGIKSLGDQQAEPARVSFEAGRANFARARDLLGPQWLRGVPLLGRQLDAASDLATIGVEGSTAGVAGAELLASTASLPEGNRLNALMKTAPVHLDAALDALVSVHQLSGTLTTEGLAPPLVEAVTDLKAKLAPLTLVLERSESLRTLERYVFSGRHRFLLVAQNSAELRPTGGFMGTYGMVDLGPDGIHLETFADVYTLPHKAMKPPLPAGRPTSYKYYYFHNSNWWIDFPTSAGQMMSFWSMLKQPKVDGIIAIDMPLLQDLLRVYGPITVPESKTPITAENAMEQLHYVVESQGLDPNRKNAVVSLATQLVTRVLTMDASQVRPTLDALTKAANEKHIQVYFTDTGVQSAMVDVGWSGAIAEPAGTTDLLAVANGVIKPSKANMGVTKTLGYRVDLDADGTAQTTLQLDYRKSSRLLPAVPQQWLSNWVRVHRSQGTVRSPGSAANDARPLDDLTGRPTFGNYFRLDPGKAHTVVMRTTVPQAMVADDDGTSHYRLLLVKQADLLDTAATVMVTAPDGWRIASATATFRASGKAVPLTSGPAWVTVATALKQDLVLDLALVRL